MSIERAEGVNDSERYLKRLCDKTFLSLWSYSEVYESPGKELCDLLVIFGDDIIIFSDKDCQFPNSDNLALDWNRWFQRAIYKSACQAWGAERRIRRDPNHLFLDRTCAEPFPLNVPDIEAARFHLIIVAHDASSRCRNELGGSGSLIIDSSIKGVDAHKVAENSGSPFQIGDIDPSRTFIHVLDDTSLDIVMNTLDTISDFVTYLTRKEQFLRSSLTVAAAGEEELLAYYLMNMDEQENHDFIIPNSIDDEFNFVAFDEGLWEDFVQSPQRKAQILVNKVSYVWDALIEIFSGHILGNTQYFASHPGIQSSEMAVGFLARECRLSRRVLSEALCSFIMAAPEDRSARRYLLQSNLSESSYVFLTLPHFDWMDYEEYRTARGELLAGCCNVVKLKFPEARHIIGIATEPRFGNNGRSEDVVYFDASEWTMKDEIKAREFSEQLGILQNPNMFRLNDTEYPVQQIRPEYRFRA
jgi:hypothetical protein